MSKYKIGRTRKYYLIPAIWNAESQTRPETKAFHGVAVVDVWQHVKNGELTAFYLESDWNNAGEKMAERLITDPKYISSLYKIQKRAGKNLVKLSHKIRSYNLADFSVDQLIDFYDQLKKAWIAHDQINVPIWYIAGDFFQAKINNELSKYKLLLEDINTLLTPSKPSFSAEEELEIYKIAYNVKEEKNNFKKINRLVEKYYWIPFGYDGPDLYTFEHYDKLIKEIVESKSYEQILEKIQQIENYEKVLSKKHKEIYKRYSLPKEIKRLVETLHVLALITDERKEYTFQAHEVLYRILNEISAKLSVNPVALRFVMIDELKRLVSDKNKLEETGLRRFKNGIIVHWKEEGFEVLEGDELLKLESEVFPKIENTQEIKGQIGCRGPQTITKGRVRILNTSRENSKLEKGEILVTTMTTPEFVPAMRKSLAIVTDEGGVTCHAAIVSRELNISCIIGTKFASKVLKDGDIVEVDTDKGIVRIIK